MVSRALFVVTLLALFLFPIQALTNDLRSLGVPITGMHSMSPCWESSSLKKLLTTDGFYLRAQGLLAAAIDPEHPAFIIYEHDDGRFIAILRRQKNNVSCVLIVGNDFGVL